MIDAAAGGGAPPIPSINGGDAGPSSAGLRSDLGINWGSDFMVTASGARANSTKGENTFVLLGILALAGLIIFRK